MLTLEQALYLGIFALALATRLWALGDRAIHHDESHHAYYSWLLYQGRGYVHDPLLHGPFLYHLGALIFLLFGDTNSTARLGTALFGSVLCVLPYLMRRELGRGAALLAAIYMLISPTFLYVSRFIRHDTYAVTFELLTFIALVRYASTRRPLWLYVGAAALGLMFTTMETFFLYLAIFVPLLAWLFFWRVWKPGALVVAGLGLLLVALVFVLPGKPVIVGDGVERANGPYVCPSAGQLVTPENPMVYRPGPLLGLPPLATADNNYALCVRNQPDNSFAVYFVKLGQFASHPSILAALALAAAAGLLLWWAVWRRRGAGGQTAWERARAVDDPIIGGFASLSGGRRWLIALGIFFVIYGLLFTALLTNTVGVISGAAGSLLYWLAQHGVQRGNQPWYYYLVILAIYEPLLLLWGAVGFTLAGGVAGRRLRGRSTLVQDGALNWPVAMPLALGWWAALTLLIYSWAGEKMPWLTMHVALPLLLLAAWALARTLAWWRARAFSDTPADQAVPGLRGLLPRGEWKPLRSYLGIFAVVMITGFILLAVVSQPAGTLAWMTPFIPLGAAALAGLLTLGFGLARGGRWALGALALGVTLIGAFGTARAAIQVAYQWGDVPREMLVYTQTSPDVARVIDRLEAASILRGGALDLPVWYDNETVWNWYLRNFTRGVEQGPDLSAAPGPEVAAVLMLQENIDRNPRNLEALSGFRVQRLPLRWWFPENEMYRLPPGWLTAPVDDTSPLLMRVLRTPLDGRTAAQFWQFMLFRRMPAPLGSSDFVLAVRPELANEFGLGTGVEQRPGAARGPAAP
jgi:hypothetical protein